MASEEGEAISRRGFHEGVLAGMAAAAGTSTAAAATPSPEAVGSDDGLPVPAQTIPIPRSASPQAQAFLQASAKRIRALASKPPGSRSEAVNDGILAAMRQRAAAFMGDLETVDIGNGAKLYRAVPERRAGRAANVAYFDIHGGGFVSGGGAMCEAFAKLKTMDYGVEVWSVDYRLAPQSVFPAALNDCVAAYRHVLGRCSPGDLVAGGGSAGGNLIMATLLRARAQGLPMPAGVVLNTPAADLSGEGDSRWTNRYLDPTLYGGSRENSNSYVGGADPKSSEVSPVYGTYARDWPPTILTTGTRDLLLSDTVRLHRVLRRAGVRAELHVTEASGHTGFMGAPEDMEIVAECRRFCNEAWRMA